MTIVTPRLKTGPFVTHSHQCPSYADLLVVITYFAFRLRGLHFSILVSLTASSLPVEVIPVGVMPSVLKPPFLELFLQWDGNLSWFRKP